jgi:pimeloyl-ACP methyl ester carboxylesterase
VRRSGSAHHDAVGSGMRATGWRRHVLAITCAAALLGLSACGPPIGVVRVDARYVQRSLTANVLSTGHASEWSRNTVSGWGLLDRYEKDPEAALSELRAVVTSGRGGGSELFALSELSFLYAEKSKEKPYYLAATVYAYAFLLPKDPEDAPRAIDPRVRLAADLYNRALTQAFKGPRGTVELTAGRYALPFGAVDVTIDPASFDWGDRHLTDFLPIAEFAVHGMRNRYRFAGVGAPLAARAVPRPGVDVDASFIGPNVRVAATAFLRLENVHDGIVSGELRGRLELYKASDAETVTVNGRDVPLEIEETATIASQLGSASLMWKNELWGYLGRGPSGMKLPILVSTTPYDPGRIPVVFVHGTASSPGRWANMLNDLLADPWVRRRFQFWFFMYDTGNPIAYSALLLRDKLTDMVARLDPDDRDPCLRQMIVIGHSQGGLLTKLTAVDTGARLWNAVSRVPIDDVPISPESRELLRRALFVEPLPFVRRLVFIATPHRGSFVAGQWFSNMVNRWVRLPRTLLTFSRDALLRGRDAFYAVRPLGRLPTAAENMTAGNPFLEGLAAIPVVASVPYHSIIAVKGRGPFREGNDGVVAYRSAHLEGAASELVVRSAHSTQSEPATIQEVRRILHVHGDAIEAAGLRCVPARSAAANHVGARGAVR